MFRSNSIKIKSIKDWNEIILKIYFSSQLLFKRTESIKVRSMIDDPKVRLLYTKLSIKLPSSITTTAF